MKIYLNRKPKFGPWGGGAKLINSLVEKLLKEGHEVVFNLQENIDLLICFDPRNNDYNENYFDILNYSSLFNKKILQRVGDLGTHGKPDLTKFVKFCVEKSDFLIFPSVWAKNFLNYKKNNYSIIENAPLEEFYSNRNKDLSLNENIKIVTHHWSDNKKKGFDLYKDFDNFCKSKNNIEFTYIGRKPQNIEFINYISPKNSKELSNILPKFDIYLTASEEEAGANHVLEAIACGLPVMYKNSGGSIVEYCKNYGCSYTSVNNIDNSLKKILDNFLSIKKSILDYNNTTSNIIDEYYEIIKKLK